MWCETSRSAGGRRGHRRGWPLAGEASRRAARAARAGVRPGQVTPGAFAYVGALLAEPGDRRSCWQLAEAAGHATPRRMQALLAEHAWDWKAALKGLQRFILAHLGDPGAVLVIDCGAEAGHLMPTSALGTSGVST